MKTIGFRGKNGKYVLECEGLTVTCTCPGFEHHKFCYHALALKAVLIQQSFPDITREEALRLAEIELRAREG